MARKFMAVVVCAVVVLGAARAADMSKVPDPHKNMKVGQWVSYTLMAGMEQKQTITAIEGSGDERVITAKIDMMQGGNVLQSQEMQYTIKESKAKQQEAWAAAPDMKITEEKVTVGGKEYDAVVLEFTQEGMTTKVFMSEKIPVSGLLKMEISGMGTMMELADFGS